MVSVSTSGCAARRHGTIHGDYGFNAFSEGGVRYVSQSTGAPAPVRTRFSDILPNRYGLNAYDGYVDLSPGMRLAIQNVVISTQSDSRTAGRTIKSNVAYYLVNGSERKGNVLRPAGGTGTSGTLDDVARTFTRSNRHKSHYRYFYSMKFVSLAGEPLRGAVLFWVDSKEKLDRYSEQAKRNPTLSCEGAGRSCIAFSGLTTSSVEIPLQVNGTLRYVDVGSTVRDVIWSVDGRKPDAGTHANPHALRTLQMFRQFGGQNLPVHWRENEDILTFPVVQGDILSWRL